MLPLSARQTMPASALDDLQELTANDGCVGMSIELHPFDGGIELGDLDEPLFSDTEESLQERDFASDDSDSNSDSEDGDSDFTPPGSPPCAQMDFEYISPTVYLKDNAAADQRQWLRSIFAAGEIFLREPPPPTIAPVESARTSGIGSKYADVSPSPAILPIHSVLADEQVLETCDVADTRFVCIAHLRRPPLPPPTWNRRRFADLEDSLRRQVLEKAASRVGQPTADANWWFNEDEGATMASV